MTGVQTCALPICLCLAGFIFVYVRQCLQLFRLDRGQTALYLGLLFQMLLTNLSESHWFSPFSVDFTIFILASTAMARGLLELRLRHQFGDPNATCPAPKVR